MTLKKNIDHDFLLAIHFIKCTITFTGMNKGISVSCLLLMIVFIPVAGDSSMKEVCSGKIVYLLNR